MKNLLQLPLDLPGPCGPEIFEDLFAGPGPFRLERIVSNGQTTPPGEFYDQERDEWVLLLEGAARIVYADGREVSLGRGDALFLPRRVRHRVSYTSSPCIWLALHGRDFAFPGGI